MTSELQERIAKAMAEKRRELIARPLADIWLELSLAAMKAAREPTAIMSDIGEQMLDVGAEAPSTYGAMLDAEIDVAEEPSHD